ncbi:MAG: radical SAM protein [Hyphomicrobiaceae bacterium]|nr:MAG: radical SAM protein [Hyphomicrobiaceae bacterium]
MIPDVEPPFLVALNLTRRCNLACAHCYLDAGTRTAGGPGELRTEELTSLIGRIAALGRETMLVLTGGEPLLRPDLDAIARRASDLGLMVVVGTNGTLLDEPRVAALRAAGVHAVGISLDSLDPAYHDRFRRRQGAWQAATSGIDACRRGGLMFQIHFTVTDDNADDLDGMIDFARSAGAAVLNVFFLVCTGRGRSLSNISVATYEDVLRRLAEAARDETDLIVRARCAPHFKRLAREMRPPLPITLADGYEAGGCLAGRRYCRVTPEGEVTPCPYMEASAGSVRDRDFTELWRGAPLFAALRSPKLEGRCGRCEYARLCGGCRARPLARDGNLMGEDFLCGYQPAGGAVIEAATTPAAPLTWAADAEARLSHVPVAVRGFVRRRVETYARECGETTVTAAHLDVLARRRFASAHAARQRPVGTP